MKTRSASSGYKNPGSFSALIDKTDTSDSITKCKRAPNSRVYKSINVMSQDSEGEKQKRVLRYIFKKKLL